MLFTTLFVAVAVALSLGVARMTLRAEEVVEEVVEETTVGYEQSDYLISPYDNLFREVSAAYSFDWRLMSAMAEAESRFRVDAKSRSGAMGLMQVMPLVAKNYGYSKEELLDAKCNVEVSARLLSDVRRMLKPMSGVSSRDSLSFVLASYNAGYTRVADARALAKYYNDDHNCWSVVAEYLSLLSEAEYYENEVVKRGRFTGSGETIAYVNKVLSSYDAMCSRVAL